MDYRERYNSRNNQQPNNSSTAKQLSSRILPVKWACRWDVFRRLQALDIECECSTNKPLLVNFRSPTTVAQIWSVVRQFDTPRQELIHWLDNCWEIECDQPPCD